MPRFTHSVRRLQSFIAPALLLILTIILCEFFLRIIPSPVQFPSVYETDDPKSLLGIELVPGAQETQTTSCSSWTVTVNSLGWRDIERTIERVPGKIRIAVLGDSFTEGAAVEDTETFTRQLENRLGSDVEVLNFGLSSLGTVQEEILYEHVVAAYKPDIVLLAMYMNDVSNNSPILEGGPEKKTRLTYRDESGERISYLQPSSFFAIRKWLRVHSAIFRLLKSVHRIARSIGAGTGNTVSYGLPSQYLVFGPPPNDTWSDAWRSTQLALSRLNAGMKDGQQFFFFVAPSVLEVAQYKDQVIRDEFGVDPPDSFDARYFHTRLHTFASEANIKTLDLLPGFLAYIKDHDLQYPFFSRTCDGHWAALGHSVAADILAEQLRPIIANVRR